MSGLEESSTARFLDALHTQNAGHAGVRIGVLMSEPRDAALVIRKRTAGNLIEGERGIPWPGGQVLDGEFDLVRKSALRS